MSAPESRIVTIGFQFADDQAFDDFWKEIRDRFDFLGVSKDEPVRAFAISKSDMFEEQAVIEAIMESDLDYNDQLEAIGEVPCADLRKLCEEWGVKHPYPSKRGAA